MNIPNDQNEQGTGQPVGDPGGDTGGGQQANPVVDAVKTISVYIAGLAENGDPTAPQLQQIMAQFVQTLRGSEGGEMATSAPGGEGEPNPMRQQDQAPGGGRGMNPMLGNMGSGTRPAARGQVAVI
jgi:hypothetical protein